MYDPNFELIVATELRKSRTKLKTQPKEPTRARIAMNDGDDLPTSQLT